MSEKKIFLFKFFCFYIIQLCLKTLHTWPWKITEEHTQTRMHWTLFDPTFLCLLKYKTVRMHFIYQSLNPVWEWVRSVQ